MKLWLQVARVPRCAVCRRRVSRLGAYAEQVAGKVVALCAKHAPK